MIVNIRLITMDEKVFVHIHLRKIGGGSEHRVIIRVEFYSFLNNICFGIILLLVN